ncbi:MFS transporter [Methylobacterium gregans]|uniref:MFS-type transporter YfcJ n=1 Tax=Methylobacterium gregans TaxID=374424 RepID=A0AA37MC95_9HYPH|nr:MFS transporter [Methylobacterium gregans]MDQ0522450.1 MFS family permease [Methylobacterium gregans]GJD79546.1 putative MFS-type transporter YfcJ [Methylobacterium gregans]
MTTMVETPAGARKGIPAGIWALGFVSMLMDISSEMIHALLPIYMVTVLGTSTLAVGIIEGVAEATASIVKVFSGALSDRLGKRKLLAVLGYGLSALTKPIFPLAGSLEWLVAARFVDRVGKGIRGAPRDALVADLAPPELRGASFGLRQTLDTIGAFTGPLLAIGLMWLFANDFQAVFWVAVLPAFLSVAVLVFAVKDPATTTTRRPARLPLHRQDLARLGVRYWWVVAVAVVLTLARFSEAFLLLRVQEFEVQPFLLPLVLVVMGVAYSLSSYPVGVLSDRIDRVRLLQVGLVLLVLADVTLAFAPNLALAGLGVALWGLHMGFSQGLLAAMVADTATADLRGTAFGMFNLLTGLALLVASVTAGALWDAIGSSATFLAGAAFSALALGGLFVVRLKPAQ